MDELEDMDLSLIKGCERVEAVIYRTWLQPNYWTYITFCGTKWKNLTLPFLWYLIIQCSPIGLVMMLCQSWMVFDVSQKTKIIPKRLELFRQLFSKCPHLHTNQQRHMKLHHYIKEVWEFSYKLKGLEVKLMSISSSSSLVKFILNIRKSCLCVRYGLMILTRHVEQ